MEYEEAGQRPQPPSFALVPLNSLAVKVVEHIKNQSYQTTLDKDTIGLLVSFDDPEKQYLTLGRKDCDIYLPELKGSKTGVEISEFQASFHVVEETGAVILTDHSVRKNTEIVPTEMGSVELERAIPFREPRRSVVVCKGINPRITFGHVQRYMFGLEWRSDGLYDFPDKNEPYVLGPRKRRSKRYIQGYKIASGTRGIVYWAIDGTSGAKIAIKKVHTLSDLGWVARKAEDPLMARERNLESRAHILDSMDIVAGRPGDNWAEIFMPLMAGNLKDLVLVENSLSTSTEDLVLTVFRHMLHALSHLESWRFIHRNIKPENILWEYNYEGAYHFRLGGFGLPNDGKEGDIFVAQDPFVAPELYKRRSSTYKADIWSLFATIVWVRNTEGFRDSCQRMSITDIHEWLVTIARSDEYRGVRDMASRNPSKRPSAQALLLRLEKAGDEVLRADEGKTYEQPSSVDEAQYIEEEPPHPYAQAGTPYYEPYNSEAYQEHTDGGGSSRKLPRGKAKGKSMPEPNYFVFASEEDDESDDSETNAPVVSRKRLPSTAPEKEHRSVSTVEAKNIDQRGNDTAELEKLVPSADSGRRLSSSSESRDVKLKVPIRHLDSIEPIATPGLTSQDPSETAETKTPEQLDMDESIVGKDAVDEPTTRPDHVPGDEPGDPQVEDALSEVSDTTDTSSIFSSATDSTRTSVSTVDTESHQTMAAQLAYILCRDPDLSPLYSQALQLFGAQKFSINHNKFLRTFMKDLLRLAPVGMLKQVISFLGKRRLREQVTSHVLRMVGAESTMATLLSQEEDRSFALNRLLSQRFSAHVWEAGNPSDGHKSERLKPAEVAQSLGIAGEDRNVPPDDSESSGLRDEAENLLQTEDLPRLGENDKDGEDNDQIQPLDDSEGSELSDEAEDEDDNKRNYLNRHVLLNAVTEFFTTGPPFDAFKSNIACFANPPKDIPSALATKNPRALRRLLRSSFNQVAQGEYTWLHELEDLGHTRDEIAQLLFEEATDSPWIYLSNPPSPISEAEIQLEHHLPGCVHQFSTSADPTSLTITQAAPRIGNSAAARVEIQRMCGLAGIFPWTRDQDNWNGSVSFEEDNTVTSISYSHTDTQRLISRIVSAFEHFCSAVSLAQAAGCCCESFTILRRSFVQSDEIGDEELVIEISRVSFSLVLQMRREIRQLSSDLASAEGTAATRLIDEIFRGLECPAVPPAQETATALHIYAMAVQFLSLGFQSYLQGHVGPLQPAFLDTPMRKARLLGSQKTTGSSYPSILAALENLTCVGDMLQGPVLVFTLLPQGRDAAPARPDPPGARFDLLASPEDMIDTWGPGQFIIPVVQSKIPSAIKICGGVLYQSDTAGNRFHWSRNATLEEFCRGKLASSVKVRIGSPVTVNAKCALDEGRRRLSCLSSLRPLDTHSPYWALAERQIGIQAGNYVLVEVNAAYHHFPGRTLKQSYLDRSDEVLIPFLEEHWGVQISLCTGVARRVPLRVMIADLFPVFANNLTLKDDYELWDQLKTENNISEFFQRENLKGWLRTLGRSLHSLVLRIIRRILDALRDTGLDRLGKSLRIAWPYADDMYQCIEVDVGEHESSWARLLADSEDCATFAYASPRCLETSEIQCGGLDSSWRNAIPLLETAVIVCPRHGLSQIAMADPLLHQSRYYFRKFEAKVFVKVVKQGEPFTTRLVPTKIPLKILARVRNVQMLRERRGIQEPAETVAVVTLDS